jgi:hypothetical protein
MLKLIGQCSRLFIYAATMVRYIMDPCGSPSRRLSNITSQSATGFQASIDDLYGEILEQACTGMEQDEITEIRGFALLIVFLQTLCFPSDWYGPDSQSSPRLFDRFDIEIWEAWHAQVSECYFAFRRAETVLQHELLRLVNLDFRRYQDTEW